MSLGHGASVVRDGLVMHLDAANPKSYPGSGTTWYDLSGNNYNGTFVGTINHTSGPGGVFSWNGNQIADYLYFDVNSLQNLSSGYEWTIETLIRIDNTTVTYFHSMATTSNNNNYIVQNGSFLLPYAETRTGGSNLTFTAGETFLLTITHSGSSQLFYKNGIYYSTYTQSNDISLTEGWVLNQEQDTVLGTFDASQATDMAAASVKLYNRPLSASEIKQNFEAYRGRYGI